MSSAKVIVIGSGVSGLAAASDLIDNGIDDVLVLEAQNRLGGRTYTLPISNGASYIEVGAQWIHGSSGNPLYDLGSSIGVLDEDLKTVKDGRMYFATEDGKPVDEEFVDNIQNKVRELFDKLKEQSSELDSDTSVGQLVEADFQNMLGELELDDQQKKLARAILDTRIKEERFDTACHDLNQLSAQGWNAFEDSGGDSMINLRNGYREIVDHFQGKIGNQRIKLNSVVTKIKYPEDPSESVVIEVDDRGAKKRLTYQADRCLVTIPLGYLKTNYRNLFEPELPDSKATAIERLGFGTMNKLFLIFDEPVFKDGEQGMQVLWLNDRPFELKSAKKWGVPREFWKSIGTFEVHPKMNYVLYGFVTGEDAISTEKLSDQCLIDIFNELFAKCFAEANIPKLKTVMRSKWNSDEFTKGAYTHIKLGSSIQDVEALAEPLNSKVFFAGEATSTSFMSTVHGAFESGLNAAKNIADAINNN